MTREEWLAALPRQRVIDRAQRGYLCLPCDCGEPGCNRWGSFSDRGIDDDLWRWSPEEIAEARAHRESLLR